VETQWLLKHKTVPDGGTRFFFSRAGVLPRNTPKGQTRDLETRAAFGYFSIRLIKSPFGGAPASASDLPPEVWRLEAVAHFVIAADMEHLATIEQVLLAYGSGTDAAARERAMQALRRARDELGRELRAVQLSGMTLKAMEEMLSDLYYANGGRYDNDDYEPFKFVYRKQGGVQTQLNA
jgi:hypothetical protein